MTRRLATDMGEWRAGQYWKEASTRMSGDARYVPVLVVADVVVVGGGFPGGGKPVCRFIHYHGTIAAVGHAAGVAAFAVKDDVTEGSRGLADPRRTAVAGSDGVMQRHTRSISSKAADPEHRFAEGTQCGLRTVGATGPVLGWS
jgi:hypothetical protein